MVSFRRLGNRSSGRGSRAHLDAEEPGWGRAVGQQGSPLACASQKDDALHDRAVRLEIVEHDEGQLQQAVHGDLERVVLD